MDKRDQVLQPSPVAEAAEVMGAAEVAGVPLPTDGPPVGTLPAYTPGKRGFYTTFIERMSYGFYTFGQYFYFILISQFMMLYLTDYRMVPPAAVGIIFLLGRVWDAVNDPLFGVIVDKTNFKRGKYKPWVTIASLMLPFITIACFAMPDSLGMGAKIAYAATTYILYGMVHTVCDVPIMALVTTLTNNIQERTTILTISRFFVIVGSLVIAMAIMPLVLSMGWVPAVILLCVVGFLFTLPINLFAKERFIQKRASAYTLKEIFSYLIHNKYLLLFYASILLTALTNTGSAISSYIAKYLLGGENMIPLMMLAVMLPTVLAPFFVPALARKFDKFKVYVTSQVLLVALSLTAYFVGYANPYLALVFIALRAVPTGFMAVLMVLFAADCVEYGNFKTGTRAAGITFSIQTFTTKLNAALAGAITGFALTFIDYDGATAATQGLTPSTQNGLWACMLLIPCIGYILSMVVLYFYKLRDKDVQVMAKCNQGEITREEAEAQLSRKY